jgi:hypothetical protein
MPRRQVYERCDLRARNRCQCGSQQGIHFHLVSPRLVETLYVVMRDDWTGEWARMGWSSASDFFAAAAKQCIANVRERDRSFNRFRMTTYSMIEN